MTAKYLLVYTAIFVLLSALDVSSTQLVLAWGVGKEANPMSPLSIPGMLLNEALILGGGVFMLWLSRRIGWRAFSEAHTRSIRELDKISSGAMWAPMFLLVATLLLWIKLVGATSNFLLLGTGKGLYDLLRSTVPGVSDDAFYWLFAMGSNLLFFFAGSAFLFYRWKKGKPSMGNGEAKCEAARQASVIPTKKPLAPGKRAAGCEGLKNP